MFGEGGEPSPRKTGEYDSGLRKSFVAPLVRLLCDFSAQYIHRAKVMISSHRNNLSDEVVEASEYLRAWFLRKKLEQSVSKTQIIT